MRGTVLASTRQTGTVPGRSCDSETSPYRKPAPVDSARLKDLAGSSERSSDVRYTLVVLATLALAGAPASAARYKDAGLSVDVPAGWTVVTKPMSECTNPVQRLALRGHGALVQIVETLDYAYVHRFPARPRRFALRGPARYVACCPPREAKGWFLSFRDGNRGFYAYVYLGRPGSRAQVLRILDSLGVRPRA